MSEDQFTLEARDLQYQYFVLELTDEKVDMVRVQYDGTEYNIEIQDGQPVVVADV